MLCIHTPLDTLCMIPAAQTIMSCGLQSGGTYHEASQGGIFGKTRRGQMFCHVNLTATRCLLFGPILVVFASALIS